MTDKTGKETHPKPAEKPKANVNKGADKGTEEKAAASTHKPEAKPAPQEKKTAADAGQEPKTAAKKPEEHPAAKKKPAHHGDRHGPGFSGLVAVFALLLSLGLGGAAWYFWQQLQGIHKILDIKANVDAQQQDHQKLSQLGEQQSGFRQELAQLRAVLERTTRLPSNNNWLDIEALIQLAMDRAQLNQDVDGAIIALQWADQRLGKLGEPGLASLRRQVAKDIQALQAVNLPDYPRLDQKIQQIAEDASKLALRSAAPHDLLKDANQKPGTDAKPETRGWKRLFTDALKELKPLVTIRRKHEVTPPMLTAEEAAVLRQILQLRLERVRMQLALKKQAGFTAAINEALQWLQQHYQVDTDAYKQLTKSLQDLRATQLQPALPDISGSLRELRAYRALLQGKSS